MAGSNVVKVLKIAGWTLVSLVVAVSVMLVCAVKFIDSKYLAPMVEDMAKDYVDGDVKIGDLRLAFNPHFPILGIELDDLSIISHAFDSLSPEQRGHLPNYTDSLLMLDHLSGALDIKRLLINNELSLHNVALRGLSINIVIANNGKPNYEVMKLPSDSAQSSKSKIPGFRINHFSLDQPKEIRFYNAADSTSASVLLLTDAAVDGEEQPTYRLKISGNVTSPKATLMTNLDEISFGLNGKVYWNPTEPGLIAMDDMEIRGAFIKAVVSGEIDLTESPIARKATVDLAPVAISDILSLLPDSIKQDYRLHPPYFSTNMAVGGRFELTQPMNLATDTLPAAKIRVSISPSVLNYGNAHLKDIELELLVNTETNLPDRTTIDLSRFAAAAPGTDLKASAYVSTPISDPTFDANVEGKVDIRDLPPVLLEKIPGYIAGVITADLKAKGSVSMLRLERLHHLIADGTVTTKNFYFLTADTTKLVEVGNARIELDSKRITDGIPLLKAKVDIDTTTVLVSGIDLAFRSVSLTAGVDNPSSKTDTTLMHPVDAALKVGQFNITSITDGAGARIRNINGPVRIAPLKGKGPLPKISTDLLIGKVSAGTLSDRFLINDTKVKASLYKEKSLPRQKKQIDNKKTRQHREYTYISPEDVHKYVYYRRTHRKHHTKRVYTEEGPSDDEMLVWNLTPQFQRFLNEWELTGTVNTDNARLLTPIFPLKNHISNLALRFNNDTVNISNISLRAGNSDITMSGIVSNVRRAFTAKTDNALKGNLSLLSDTIDINEISSTIFTGAVYSSDRRKGKVDIKAKDDKALAKQLDEIAKKGPGKGAPVLIPVNIDAKLKIMANKLLYSDVEMQNMGADLLVYDGGVNLHDMTADSDAGNLSLSALYSAPNPRDMHFGFGMRLNDFNIAKFVKMVPAIDSITPLMHDFSGIIGANIAATCRIDSAMNIDLPSLNAAMRITGDNLAFIDPEKYRTLGKWLGFKDKADNTIHSLNVEMTVEDGLMHVYPFAFNIDRYRLGIYGSNNMAMDFDYHLAVLKSPIPFKFGITVSGSPKKYKVRFGGAKFKEDSVIESVDVVNNARINLIDQIQGVFRRGVRNSRFAKLQIARPADFDAFTNSDLSSADSLRLIQEGLLDSPANIHSPDIEKKKEKKKKHKRFWIF